MNLELMVTVLSSNGYRVLPADGGFTALELVSTETPQLVLMDIQMPEMDGYTLLNQLRQNEAHRDIPVIAVTGNAMPHDIEKIHEGGFDEFLSKPFRIAELLKVVGKYLDT